MMKLVRDQLGRVNPPVKSVAQRENSVRPVISLFTNLDKPTMPTAQMYLPPVSTSWVLQRFSCRSSAACRGTSQQVEKQAGADRSTGVGLSVIRDQPGTCGMGAFEARCGYPSVTASNLVKALQRKTYSSMTKAGRPAQCGNVEVCPPAWPCWP
jgi:hypothetical protein